jgi:hypothetical protein
MKRINYIANREYIAFTYNINGEPVLLETYNDEGQHDSKEYIYANYPQSDITKLEDEIIAIDDRLKKDFNKDEIFLQNFPENEEKFVGLNIKYLKNGTEVQTKIIGFNSITGQFQLENFISMANIENLFYNGTCLTELL